MNLINQPTTQINFQTLNQNTESNSVSDVALEAFIGTELIEDYNQQLGDIAQIMRGNLSERDQLQTQLQEFQKIENQSLKSIGLKHYYPLNPQATEFLTQNYPDLKLTQNNGENFIEEKTLRELMNNKEQDLASLNSGSEIMALKIQSLVNQRKNALTLLSNLMAKNHQTMMSVINNIK